MLVVLRVGRAEALDRAGPVGRVHLVDGAEYLGLLLFGLASALSAFAQDPLQLILARAFMGIGGASVLPVTLAIITVVFPAPKNPDSTVTGKPSRYQSKMPDAALSDCRLGWACQLCGPVRCAPST